MPKFRKKSVVVEAQQYIEGKQPWPPGVRFSPEARMSVETLNGFVTIEDREWIVKGVEGEFYPVKDHVFQQTFELVEED